MKKKLLLATIIGFIFGIMCTAGASIILRGDQVSYQPVEGDATDVQSAMDDVFSKINTKAIDGDFTIALNWQDISGAVSKDYKVSGHKLYYFVFLRNEGTGAANNMRITCSNSTCSDINVSSGNLVGGRWAILEGKFVVPNNVDEEVTINLTTTNYPTYSGKVAIYAID